MNTDLCALRLLPKWHVNAEYFKYAQEKLSLSAKPFLTFYISWYQQKFNRKFILGNIGAVSAVK